MKLVRMGIAATLILTLVVSVVSLTSTVIDVNQNTRPNESLSITTPDFIESELDLDRVDWKMNFFPNPGLELWVDPHTPENLGSYYGDRTQEEWTWYASSPWPVNEGSRSMGFQAKAVDPTHEALAYAYTYTNSWDNMVNLTLQLDWYIDELPIPVDSDAFYFIIWEDNRALSYTRHIVYYFGIEDTSLTNSTFTSYCLIDGPTKTWNTLMRNVTADWIEIFSVAPDSIERIDFNLLSTSQSYSRAFADNLILTNNTVLNVEGDFESGSWSRSHSDPADISQNSESVEGDWSLNVTTISNGNASSAHWTFDPYRRATSLNPDSFSFWWKLEEFQIPMGESYGYINVAGWNSSGDEFGITYFLYSGDELPWTPDGNYHFINVTGFNTTDVWHHFDRSIFTDIASFNQTDDFIITEVEFQFDAHGKGIRTELLLDDCILSMPSLSDMGYEDQGAVGEEVSAWEYDDYGNTPYMTVTDFALNGSKAANITVADGQQTELDVGFEYRPVTLQTETSLYLNWRFEDFTGVTDEIVYIMVYPSQFEGFAYIFANGSEASSADGFNDRFFLLPELSQTGEWFNFHRNLYSDMVTIYGDEPDLGLSSISIIVESRTGGRIEFLLDDVYLYNDVAPEIMNIMQTPAIPEYHEDVTVSADIIDSNPDDMTLHYRMNSGAWNNVSMMFVSGYAYSGTIPAQAFGDVVEYFITALDIAGKTDVGLDGGVYFSYTTVDNIPPSLAITAPLNESTVHGIQEISVSASDLGSGIDYVEFLIDSVSMVNDTTSPYSYSWNTSDYAEGEHTIVAKAFDLEGNENSVMIIVDVTSVVTTTTSTTTTTTSPSPSDNTLLLIVGVVGVVVVVVVIVVVMRKKQSS